MDMYGLRRYTGDKNRPKEMTFPAKKKKKQNKTLQKGEYIFMGNRVFLEENKICNINS